jgi:hypothetical protein
VRSRLIVLRVVALLHLVTVSKMRSRLIVLRVVALLPLVTVSKMRSRLIVLRVVALLPLVTVSKMRSRLTVPESYLHVASLAMPAHVRAFFVELLVQLGVEPRFSQVDFLVIKRAFLVQFGFHRSHQDLIRATRSIS